MITCLYVIVCFTSVASDSQAIAIVFFAHLKLQFWYSADGNILRFLLTHNAEINESLLSIHPIFISWIMNNNVGYNNECSSIE